MSEGYLRPEDMVKISIAESNVAEQLRTLCRMLLDEYIYFRELLKLFMGTMYGAVESEYPKIRNAKDGVEQSIDRAMEYLIRVGIGLNFKDMYASIIQEIGKVAELLDAAAHRILILSKLEGKLSDRIQAFIERIADNIRASLEKFDSATSLLLVNPKKTIELVSDVFKIEEAVDELYRELSIALVTEVKSERELIVLKDIVEILEEVADVVRHAASALKYVALHKV